MSKKSVIMKGIKMDGQSSSCAEHGFENPEGVSKTSLKWEELVKELKIQWRKMWRERIDDKVRAEGIAKEDYSLLFLECGTVVVATRKYKAPDLLEILERHHRLLEIERTVGYVNPFVGGWRKFIRNALSKQQRFTKRKRLEPTKSEGKETLQKKNGGRGWIHQF